MEAKQEELERGRRGRYDENVLSSPRKSSKRKILAFCFSSLTQITQLALPELIALENASFLKSFVKANPYQIYKGNHFLHSKDKQNKQS